MKNWIKEALIVGVALIISAIVMHHVLMQFVNKERVVYVKGLSEREVKADYVTWPLVYTQVGNDMRVMYAQIKLKNKEIIDFLVAGGIQENDIYISSPSIEDRDANRYGDNKSPYRYFGTSVITVSSASVDAVIKLMQQQEQLLAKGILMKTDNYQYRPAFSYKGLNKIKPEMIEEATKNARLSAEKFAKDSNSSLGKIKTANQGQFTIRSLDDNTAYIKKIRVVSSVTYYLKN